MAPQASEGAGYPLYSTTFTIHRLSPLWHGETIIDSATLQQYGSRFRDILAGDVLRGVRVGLASDDDALARVGALRHVNWRALKGEEDWQVDGEETQLEGDTMGFEKASAGIHIEVAYEKTTYIAILLQQSQQEGGPATGQAAFSHYPLLLTRMPGPLRETFLDFLASNFDAKASVMKLAPQFLISSLEKYMLDITTGEDGPIGAPQAGVALRTVLKDLLFSVSFQLSSGASSLKTIDITVPKHDLWPMLSRGRRVQQVTNTAMPFTTSLTHYINEHMALDLENPQVIISRVACGAFVLGAEGRVKIFPPSISADGNDVQVKATKALIASLISHAKENRITDMSNMAP